MGLFGDLMRSARNTRTLRFTVTVTQRWHQFYGWITTKIRERKQDDGGFGVGWDDGGDYGFGSGGGSRRSPRRRRSDDWF